jgi:hypothetical protein
MNMFRDFMYNVRTELIILSNSGLLLRVVVSTFAPLRKGMGN